MNFPPKEPKFTKENILLKMNFSVLLLIVDLCFRPNFWAPRFIMYTFAKTFRQEICEHLKKLFFELEWESQSSNEPLSTATYSPDSGVSPINKRLMQI